ncbi:hypothetical protein Emin_1386 [Elusimicrobium minutum Pei191]|uniref:Haem-binding uptake Tiki superfamily ChaN domain-containing protein n=1 Tax=Elusimicrobium minutum (strain Pei191) TaxID=445932 RepID=B2KEI9_ELUMP|nr:hypothetical protein [Elusimicrobium minutum]ACC98935.1 hypothetical protein Emin_1386 [Elusimicrobium minutum Pei191]
MKKTLTLLLAFTAVCSHAQQVDFNKLSKEIQKEKQKISVSSPDSLAWFVKGSKVKNEREINEAFAGYRTIKKNMLSKDNINNELALLFNKFDVLVAGEDHTHAVPLEKLAEAVIFYNKTAPESKKIKIFAAERQEDHWTEYINKQKNINPNDNNLCKNAAQLFYNGYKGTNKIYKTILTHSFCLLEQNGVKVIPVDLRYDQINCPECNKSSAILKNTQVSVISHKGLNMRNMNMAQQTLKHMPKQGKAVIYVGALHITTDNNLLGVPAIIRSKNPNLKTGSVLISGGRETVDKTLSLTCGCAFEDKHLHTITIAYICAQEEDSLFNYILHFGDGNEDTHPVNYLLHYDKYQDTSLRRLMY